VCDANAILASDDLHQRVVGVERFSTAKGCEQQSTSCVIRVFPSRGNEIVQEGCPGRPTNDDASMLVATGERPSLESIADDAVGERLDTQLAFALGGATVFGGTYLVQRCSIGLCNRGLNEARARSAQTPKF
jgi:hypothetical protein